MWQNLLAVILGAIGSILAIFIVEQFQAGRRMLRRVLGLNYKVAAILAEGGVHRVTLCRADLHRYEDRAGTLREYLDTAKHTIDIVSISLGVTEAEGALISLFEQKISGNEDFIVRITLLNPSSLVIPLLAKSLALAPNQLEKEIRDTLDKLSLCKNALRKENRHRLLICVHDTLPIGSAILLDARPESGRIQVETKLYRAPRTESFGFEVVGPSSFYQRNYTAWRKVFGDSTEWTPIIPDLS